MVSMTRFDSFYNDYADARPRTGNFVNMFLYDGDWHKVQMLHHRNKEQRSDGLSEAKPSGKIFKLFSTLRKQFPCQVKKKSRLA